MVGREGCLRNDRGEEFGCLDGEGDFLLLIQFLTMCYLFLLLLLFILKLREATH
jgi:hypothetical protein